MTTRSPRAPSGEDPAIPLAQAHLVLLTGLGAGRVWPVVGEVVVGRGTEASLMLHDTEVSRRHLRLVFDGLTCRMQDLGSVNGTYLNDERISGEGLRALRDGDQLRLGPSSVLQFRLTVDAGQVDRRLSEVFQQLQTALAELEVARNSAGRRGSTQLLASVRTEVGRPLRAVASDLEFAISELPRLPSEPGRVGAVLRAVSDALLGVAHVRRMFGDTGGDSREEPDSQEVDVNELVEAALAECMTITRSRIQIFKELGPAQAVRGSALRLQPVVLQLLLEAVRAVAHMSAEQAVIRVRTRVSRTAAAIEIQDTGPGFTPDELQMLFSDRPLTVPASGGQGLSLQRCREQITAAEGELRVVSERGKGTAFQVVLRKIRPEDHASQVTNPAILLRRGRVLFVPAETAVIDLVVRTLRGEHDVTLAQSIGEATQALRGAVPYDLVIVDLAADAGAIALHDRTLQELGVRAPAFVFLVPEPARPEISSFLARATGDRLPRPVDASRLRALVRARLV